MASLVLAALVDVALSHPTGSQSNRSTQESGDALPFPANRGPRGDFGYVVGQLGRCPIRPFLPPGTPTPPSHPAGTVVVLKGSSMWEPATNGGVELVLPTQVVTSVAVPENGRYRFRLAPGDYVLATPGSIVPYADVSVVAGRTTWQDVPDQSLCL